jgi:hypothetical protein
MIKKLRFSLPALVLGLACFVPRAAWAQDPSAEPLPQLPAKEPAPPARAATTSDTPVVSAGVVRTNRVDTVVVAEPGSNVSVHGGSTKHDREYEPDPGRKAAIIASPIVLGVGAAVSGIAYLSSRGSQTCTSTYTGNGYVYNCTHNNAVPPLVLYDVIVGAVPSTPRWVVGDVGGALIYTGIRGASLLVASVVDWGTDNNNWIGPFTLGFLIPMTLAVVDLATTPHREDLQPPAPKPSTEESGAIHPRITGIAPIAVTDSEHRVNGGVLSLSATF